MCIRHHGTPPYPQHVDLLQVSGEMKMELLTESFPKAINCSVAAEIKAIFRYPRFVSMNELCGLSKFLSLYAFVSSLSK